MVLLDSQAVVWWLLDDRRLTDLGARTIEAATDVAVSVASVWELEIKRAKGKYDGPELLQFLPRAGIDVLDITAAHAVHAARLPPHHADPFHRMIVAQAMLERRTLVTSDAALSAYDVTIAW